LTAPPTRRCQNCGAEVDATAEICPKCGAKIVTEPMKNPKVAAVASIVLPGIGQIYNGETRKGIPLVIVAALFLYVIITNRTILSEIADFLYIVFVLYSAYNAYTTANEINLAAS
jgi:TM2 domain-containing membrane protein YozV